MPVHVRVVWTEDPQSRALVAWDSGAEDGGIEGHRVHWALGGHLGAALGEVTVAHRVGAYEGRADVHFHHAWLEGLPAATKVRFVVESGGARSTERHFYTAPDAAVPFSLLAGGDSRSDRAKRRAMNRQIARLTADDPSVLALAHGGDYVVSGGKPELWLEWLDDLALANPPSGRVLPILPARGNHEATGPLFDQVFGEPGGGLGRNFFATRLSKDAVLVTLNTERAAGGDQLAFLESTLAAHAGLAHRLVQYHRPLWPAVKTPFAGRSVWQPVFERGGVSLALESDGHVLKRTVPILGDVADPSGVVYIGEGGLGVKQRTPKATRWYLQAPGNCSSTHHLWRLDFDRGGLTVRAIDGDGREVDAAAIPRRPVAPRRR